MSETLSLTSLGLMLGLPLLLAARWTQEMEDSPRPRNAYVFVPVLAALAALFWLIARWWAGDARALLPTVAGILGPLLLLPLALGAIPADGTDGGARPAYGRRTLELYRLLVPMLAYCVGCLSAVVLMFGPDFPTLDQRFMLLAIFLAPAVLLVVATASRPLQQTIFLVLSLEWLYAAGCWALLASWGSPLPHTQTDAYLVQLVVACAVILLLWTFLASNMKIGGRPLKLVVTDGLCAAARVGWAGLVRMLRALARSILGLGKLLVSILLAAGRAAVRLPGAAARGLSFLLALLARAVGHFAVWLARAARRLVMELKRRVVVLPGLVWRLVRGQFLVLVALPAAAWRQVRRAGAGFMMLLAVTWRAILATPAIGKGLARAVVAGTRRLARALLAAGAALGRAAAASVRWLVATTVTAWTSLLHLLARLANGAGALVVAVGRALRACPALLWRGLRGFTLGVVTFVSHLARIVRKILLWIAKVPLLLAHLLLRTGKWLGTLLARLASGTGAGIATLGRALRECPSLLWRGLRGFALGVVTFVTRLARIAWEILLWILKLPLLLASLLLRIGKWLGALLARLASGAAALVVALGPALRACPALLWRGLRGFALGVLTFVTRLASIAWEILLWILKLTLLLAGLLLAIGKWLASLPGQLWAAAKVVALGTGVSSWRVRISRALVTSSQRTAKRIAGASRPAVLSRPWAPVFVVVPVLAVGVFLAVNNPPPQRQQVRIVAGSGFSSFEPILMRWGQENGVDVQVSYKGSLDIMLMLEGGNIKADAIWEGDSLWTSLGDKQHLVRSSKSIMCSPIVFGVKRLIAEELGWTGRDVSMQEILDGAEKQQLRVLMTSATQSNSGASAYFGFLYAFAGQPDVLTAEHLQDPAVGDKVRRTLASINRTSESSGWMRDLFLRRYERYDAMFNYESHILEMNQKLLERGDEPLYIVYPLEGLGIANFPFSFVSKGNDDKAPLVERLQAYLLSEPVQKEIAAKGRRVGTLCDQVDPAIFRSEWGADAERTLNAFKYPAESVIRQALALYQTSFRKPSFTVFALDFSASMEGKGKEELTKAMRTLLDQQEAAKYLLQASPNDVTAAVVFDDELMNDPDTGGWTVRGNDLARLAALLGKIEEQPVGHFTNIYLPVERALQLIRAQETGNAFPAIILMTDGQSNRGDLKDVMAALQATGLEDVPVYGITFGDADAEQLNALAELTAGRVFDGSKDLVGAFRKAKGQN